MEAIVLKNSNLRLEFGPSSGALIRLVSLKTGWEILSRPHLGLVIANYDEHRDITVKVKLDTSDSVESYRLVDDPQWRSAKQGIDIPPCSAVVVI